MTTTAIFIAIFISAACTFILRAWPFLIFSGKKKLPVWLQRLEGALPPAIMAVLIVYCLKNVPGDFLGTGMRQLIAVFVTALSYKLKHSAFISILAGTACYILLLWG